MLGNKTRVRSLRSDAKENRKLLLAAATRIFEQYGFDAPLELIALEAGMSRTSLSRHYPDKASLGFAIFERNVIELETLAAEFRGRPDAFLSLLETLMQHFIESFGLAEALGRQSGGESRIADLRQRIISALTPALRDAQAYGLVKAYLEPGDLDLLMDMFGATLVKSDPTIRRVYAQRALHILYMGLRTQPDEN